MPSFLNFGIYTSVCVLCMCVCIEREREACVFPKGFDPESFSLKFNPPTFEYKIHSVEFDLTLFQVSINQKSSVLNIFYPSIKPQKMDIRNSELVRFMSLGIQILDPAI